MNQMAEKRFMARALELAKKGYTSPNPMVGAVIVRDGDVIGEGYHVAAGQPHAEINALRGTNAQDSTLYVTLEPCSHYGRTPPCTDAIIAAGIKKVVCAMRDPNPKVDGIGKLREAGIEVVVGVLEEQARELNEIYIKHTTTGLPFVLLKTAMSLDGKIATHSGDSKWITSKRSRELSRELRGRYDSIMVGVGTVLKDDPSLRSSMGKDPLRIILDSKLRSPLDSKVFDDGNVLVVTSRHCERKRSEAFVERGIELLHSDHEWPDMKELMKALSSRGITSVFLEGGSEVNGSAVRSGIVDKFLFFIAPKVIGGHKAPGPVGGSGFDTVSGSMGLDIKLVERSGQDIVVEAYPYNRS